MMNSFDPQRQDSSFKRRSWQINNNNNNIAAAAAAAAPSSSSYASLSSFYANNTNSSSSSNNSGGKLLQGFPGLGGDDLVSAVVPAVTVVLEGRSICQRISLHNHASYHSLARALRQMFVDGYDNSSSPTSSSSESSDRDLDLSNAIPGHVIAYEDMENDLLLAGDLTWKDFVRVAKRIRILPAKGNSRKGIASTRRRES